MMKKVLTCCIAALLTIHALDVAAQPNPSGQPVQVEVDQSDPEEFVEALNGDASAVSKALAKVISDRFRFIDLSYVEPGDSDSEGGWNVAYDLKYAYVADEPFSTSDDRAKLSTLEAKLDIVGSYSFNDAANNKDLSSVKASFSYIYGDFGPVPSVDIKQTNAYQDCSDKNVLPEREKFQTEEEYNEANAKFAAEALRCIEEARVQALFDNSGTAYAYELGLHAGIEGNQDYSEKNNVYGASAVLSAHRWPSIRLNLEQVDASDNEQRTTLTEDDTYDRVTLELGYQYSINAVKNLPIILSLGYRKFYEIDAPPEVEAVGQDEFDYWSVSLRVPAKMFSFIESDDYSLFVRYTDGQLPFDLKSDSAFELGFSSNIALLGRLFD